MRKIIFYIFIFSLFSCEKDENSYLMYGILHEQFTVSSDILREQISETITDQNLTNENQIKEYDSLTKEYLSYLNQVHSDLTNQLKVTQSTVSVNDISEIRYGNDFFFEGEDNYSRKGTEYISRMENYRTEILNLIDDDKHLEKRINSLLNNSDVVNREGERIKYLVYLYKDMPLISILTHLGYQEKTILEIENDFLKNTIIGE